MGEQWDSGTMGQKHNGDRVAMGQRCNGTEVQWDRGRDSPKLQSICREDKETIKGFLFFKLILLSLIPSQLQPSYQYQGITQVTESAARIGFHDHIASHLVVQEDWGKMKVSETRRQK